MTLFDGEHGGSPGQRRRSFGSFAAAVAADIPILIPTFNNPTYTRDMVGQLRRRGLHNIVLVDNASRFPPMLATLDALAADMTVIRLTANKGPQDIFFSGNYLHLLPDVFCVTDPDLAFHPDLPETFLIDLIKLTNAYEVGKAGLALDIADRAAMRTEKFEMHGRLHHIWEWEEQFWADAVGTLEDGSPCYRAAIDTTFAVYNKRFFDTARFYDAIRVGGRYTARHRPWYRDNGQAPDEELFYKQHQKFSFHLR